MRNAILSFVGEVVSICGSNAGVILHSLVKPTSNPTITQHLTNSITGVEVDGVVSKIVVFDFDGGEVGVGGG